MQDVWMGLIKPFVLGFVIVTHRVPRRPADERRHAGRRQGDDRGGRRRLGGGDRRRFLRHAGSDRADCTDVDADRAAPAQTARTRSSTSRGAPVVVFDHVQLAFDDKVVLKDVSFTLIKGHTKIILGASGSGKSTIAEDHHRPAARRRRRRLGERRSASIS